MHSSVKKTVWALLLVPLTLVAHFLLKLVEDAVVGWVNHQIQKYLGIVSPNVEQVVDFFVAWGLPFLAAVIVLYGVYRWALYSVTPAVAPPETPKAVPETPIADIPITSTRHSKLTTGDKFVGEVIDLMATPDPETPTAVSVIVYIRLANVSAKDSMVRGWQATLENSEGYRAKGKIYILNPRIPTPADGRKPDVNKFMICFGHPDPRQAARFSIGDLMDRKTATKPIKAEHSITGVLWLIFPGVKIEELFQARLAIGFEDVLGGLYAWEGLRVQPGIRGANGYLEGMELCPPLTDSDAKELMAHAKAARR
jgi:hypothetical protein